MATAELSGCIAHGTWPTLAKIELTKDPNVPQKNEHVSVPLSKKQNAFLVPVPFPEQKRVPVSVPPKKERVPGTSNLPIPGANLG